MPDHMIHSAILSVFDPITSMQGRIITAIVDNTKKAAKDIAENTFFLFMILTPSSQQQVYFVGADYYKKLLNHKSWTNSHCVILVKKSVFAH